MAENEMFNNQGAAAPAASGNGTPVNSGNNEGIPAPAGSENGMPSNRRLDNTPSTLPIYPDEENTPSTLPIYPDEENTPSTLPIYPDEENTPSTLPIFPDTDYIPPSPIIPDGGRPTPVPPWNPIVPPSQYYGQVRFLNASTNSFPVNISIDNNAYAINSRFGTISTYDWVSDGFHTVTVRRATGLRTIVYQQTFPFVSGEKVTMVLVDSGSGLDMIRVSDMGCTNMPYNSGCYRMANMTYSGSSYDLMLYGGEPVFRNVRFGNVTSYKQAMAGSYMFYVTNANSFGTVIREIPIIVVGAITGMNTANNEPLVSFSVDIEAGKNYTTYLIGNNWSDYSFRAMTVEG